MRIITRAQIHELSPEERLRLIGLLWDSFADDPPAPPFTPAQRAELRRRVAQHEADPDSTRPWSEVRAEIEREWWPRKG